MSTFPEVSIWKGLHPDFRDQLGELLDNRLRPSSQSTISTALRKWWYPYCDKYELAYFVPDGCERRGAIMVGFVLFMANAGTMVYPTMQSYVWAVVDSHISNGYASPLSNVRDWKPFMHAVEVEWGHPSEPRRMIPWLLFIRTLGKVNYDVKWEVSVACVMLILFFVVSRPELLPTALSGPNKFDPAKHLRRRDLRWDNGYLEVGLRMIKQDPLCKRKEVVAGTSWRAIGHCTGILNTLGLVQHYLTLHSHSSSDAPMFVDDKGQTLTQPAFTRLFRVLCMRVEGVTQDVAALYGAGGFRVLGRNAIAGVEGSDAARIQGMWASDCDLQYDRAFLQRVLGLPSKMAAFAASAVMPVKGALEAAASTFLDEITADGYNPMSSAGASASSSIASSSTAAVVPAAPVPVPPDSIHINVETRTSKTGRSVYKMYQGFRGRWFDTIRKARASFNRESPAPRPPPVRPAAGPSSPVAPVAVPPSRSRRSAQSFFAPSARQLQRLRNLL